MTKATEQIRSYLLHTLADGQFHSGEALGEKLGISRAAISKHIKVLDGLGLDIYSVTGKGYKLASKLDMLNKPRLVRALTNAPGEHISVINVIDSTNDYIRQNLTTLNSGHVCLAEAQTAGRGRHGKTWHSPYGASLYLSLYWRFSAGHQALNGLSLVVGLAVARTLERINVSGVKLKWPNDVYIDSKKVAGVLIEVEGQMGSACDCVIGIGLNVNLPDIAEQIDQPYTDLKTELGASPDRNVLAAALIDQLYLMLERFSESGLPSFMQEWKKYDLFENKPVRLVMGDKELVGICRGINQHGAILLEQQNRVEAFYGGEISVRHN